MASREGFYLMMLALEIKELGKSGIGTVVRSWKSKEMDSPLEFPEGI